MMDEVHIVIGTCGEYSDRDEWVAGVYLTRDEAVAVAEGKLFECQEAKALDDQTRYNDARWGRTGTRFADDYTVVSAPIGQFGVWGTEKEKEFDAMLNAIAAKRGANQDTK